jgi:hypothetical protein
LTPFGRLRSAALIALKRSLDPDLVFSNLKQNLVETGAMPFSFAGICRTLRKSDISVHTESRNSDDVQVLHHLPATGI